MIKSTFTSEKTATELLRDSYGVVDANSVLSFRRLSGTSSNRRAVSLTTSAHFSHHSLSDEKEQSTGKRIFLQVDEEIKRGTLYGEITFATVWQSFQDHFFVDDLVGVARIYIQDKDIKIWYELENLQDVENNSVLKLNYKKPSVSPESVDRVHPALLSMTEQLDGLALGVQSILEKMTNVSLKSLENHTSKPKSVCENCATGQSAQDELSALRKTYQDYRKTTSQRLDALQTSVTLLDALQVCNPTALLRHKHAPIAQQLATLHSTLSTRLPELGDMIDDIQRDVTQHRRRPSNIQMTYIRRHFPDIRRQLQEFQQSLTLHETDMKKAWEKELQIIVHEQNQLKEWEASFEEMENDVQIAEQTIQALEQIDLLFLENSSKKEFMSLDVSESVDIEVKNKIFEELLLAAASRDSNARLQALKNAELRREREKQCRHDVPVDEFGKELDTFVSQKQFRNSGLLSAVEKTRAERDRQALEAIVRSRGQQD